MKNNGVSYLKRYGKGTKGQGWYSFDHRGVHFVGLVNVLCLKRADSVRSAPSSSPGMTDDANGLSSSTPIVLFAHVPLWTVYPEWGGAPTDTQKTNSTQR